MLVVCLSHESVCLFSCELSLAANKAQSHSAGGIVANMLFGGGKACAVGDVTIG